MCDKEWKVSTLHKKLKVGLFAKKFRQKEKNFKQISNCQPHTPIDWMDKVDLFWEMMCESYPSR